MKLNRILDNDVAELLGASSRIYLLQKATGSSVSSSLLVSREYSRHWTPVHIDFVVENLHDAANRAVKAGAICESEQVEWNGSTCATFADPFGHGFCLIEFKDETYSGSSFADSPNSGSSFAGGPLDQ